jgi:hypothetical protein
VTISTTQSSVVYIGNGSQTVFSFPFIVPDASFLEVIYTDANGIQTTLLSSQYTVFLNPVNSGAIWGVGGTITYPKSGSPIANGTRLTVTRIIPNQQLTSISNQGNFSPKTIEIALDTLEMQIQQLSNRTSQLRGIWTTNTFYNVGDVIQDGVNGSYTNNIYACISSHTSGVWVSDFSLGYWSLILDIKNINTLGSYLPLSGGTINGNLGVTGSTSITGLLTSTAHNVFSNNAAGGVNVAIFNSAISASASANVSLSTGTTNSSITFGLADNNGSPSGAISLGSAVSGFTLPSNTFGTTQSAGNSTTRLATTAFVTSAKKSNLQIFYSSGTYTPSAGMQYVIVEMVGGGGGGGGVTATAPTNGAAGGGGGSGVYVKFYRTAAEIGASQAITIGAGGAGGAAGNNAGASGGNTVFGAFSVQSGIGGGGAGAGGAGIGGNPGSTWTIPSISYIVQGQKGGDGIAVGNPNSASSGGAGGSSLLGFGGSANNSALSNPNQGRDGTGFGSGGGGAASYAGGAAIKGGEGRQGIVIVTEFF